LGPRKAIGAILESTRKSRPKAAFLGTEADQRLAADAAAAAAVAAEVAASAADDAAPAAAEAASVAAAAGAGVGAGAGAVVGAGAGASSFLPQADSAMAATREASRSDLFIRVLSGEKCRSNTGIESDPSTFR
jgi:hypothetical protein